MKRVALKTFGCRANQYDSAVISSLLAENVCEVVDFNDLADIYIINSCAITHNADKEAKQFIRKARRTNPNAIAVVTGCSAQVNPEVFKEQEGVKYVLGNSQKNDLRKIIEDYEDPEIADLDQKDLHQFSDIFFSGGVKLPNHSRSFLKIQDGCSQFCSFCIVPFARGLNRSIETDKIIEALYQLKDQNIEEVVLTGIHLGTYGKDLKPQSSLYQLLVELEKRRPVKRIRLSSIDPEELDDQMIELLAGSDFFCDHLHLPLQSGDNEVLKRMKRRYTREYFINLCHKLHQKWPELCIGTDTIVGFPGESHQAFLNTLETIERSHLAYVHSFPYSPRKGTKAFNFPDQVDPKLKKSRSKSIRELSEKLRNNFYAMQINKTLEVIIEKKNNQYYGLSSNYVPVKLSNHNDIQTGSLKNVKVVSIDAEFQAVGQIISGDHSC